MGGGPAVDGFVMGPKDQKMGMLTRPLRIPELDASCQPSTVMSQWYVSHTSGLSQGLLPLS